VAAGRGQRFVHVGRDHAVDEQLIGVGQLAALGAVIAGVGDRQIGREGEQRAPARTGVRRHPGHPRLRVQHQVDLAARAVHLDPGDRGPEVLRQLVLANQAEEGPLRVGSG
jgi:hypothetical protein